jgi:hypothetical protein
MNRAERRRQKIKAESPIKTEKFMTEEEFIRIRNEYDRRLKANEQRIKEITKQIVTESILSGLLIALNHDFGFGKKRLQRLSDALRTQLDLVSNGTIEHDELISLGEEIRIKYKLNI